jgi:hypothetical protein
MAEVPQDSGDLGEEPWRKSPKTVETRKKNIICAAEQGARVKLEQRSYLCL